MVAQRLKAGRKVLLVTKKRFIPICIKEMEHRLKELGIERVRVVENPKESKLKDPKVVPIINYGVIGTNLYKGYHSAYCLAGYYVNEDIVNSILQDVTPSEEAVAIQIITEGSPRRRKAKVVDDKYRFSDINALAQMALNQQEMDVVLQSVGRVRPYTKPREVITFQCSENPQIPYTQEFGSLGEARSFFGLKTKRKRQQFNNAVRVQECRNKGFTQQKTADQLDLSLSTVKRSWRNDGVTNPL